MKLKPLRNSRVSRVPPEATLPNVLVTMCAGLHCKWLAEDDVSQLVTNPAPAIRHKAGKGSNHPCIKQYYKHGKSIYVPNLWGG